MADQRRSRFVRWLDRYIYVERLHWPRRPDLPRLRRWQWVWYVAVTMAYGPLLLGLIEAAQGWVRPFWGGWLLALLAYPAIGFLAGGVLLLALPERRARLTTPGEGWLIGCLAALGGLGWMALRRPALDALHAVVAFASGRP